jgi:predicted dehydrogenase
MQSELKIGIIGFDTSHVVAFTRLLNDSSAPFHVPGAKIVAGVASASEDIESSISRVEGYKQEMTQQFGVTLYSSIEEMVQQVDAVLLESNDGRRHLPEVRPVFEAKKRVFIDKPLAASYRDAAEIAALSRTHDTPFFSSSSLRYDANIMGLRESDDLGQVLGCDVVTPATLDPTNPGLFWYGIHGVEILYSFMGTDCTSVRCWTSEHHDVVVGTWADGRVVTLRGTRTGVHDYGVKVSTNKKQAHTTYSREVPIYSQLLRQIVPFLQGGPAPIAVEETLEMMAFIEAAWISARENREVALQEVMQAK